MQFAIIMPKPLASAPKDIAEPARKRTFGEAFDASSTESSPSPSSSPNSVRAELVIPKPPTPQQQAAKRQALSQTLMMLSSG